MQDVISAPGPAPPSFCRTQLLGALRITVAGQGAPRDIARKIGRLLGYLACFPPLAHSRDVLIELFWPEVDPEAGRASLRNALPLLRRLLKPPRVTPYSVWESRPAGGKDRCLRGDDRRRVGVEAAATEKEAATTEPEKIMQPLPVPDLRHCRHRG
jgi:hypothetical protein